MKLYKISEEDIAKAITTPDISEKRGNKFIAVQKIPKKFTRYPLKIVYSTEKGLRRIYCATDSLPFASSIANRFRFKHENIKLKVIKTV
jgi:hypothetical protein